MGKARETSQNETGLLLINFDSHLIDVDFFSLLYYDWNEIPFTPGVSTILFLPRGKQNDGSIGS